MVASYVETFHYLLFECESVYETRACLLRWGVGGLAMVVAGNKMHPPKLDPDTSKK